MNNNGANPTSLFASMLSQMANANNNNANAAKSSMILQQHDSQGFQNFMKQNGMGGGKGFNMMKV